MEIITLTLYIFMFSFYLLSFWSDYDIYQSFISKCVYTIISELNRNVLVVSLTQICLSALQTTAKSYKLVHVPFVGIIGVAPGKPCAEWR